MVWLTDGETILMIGAYVYSFGELTNVTDTQTDRQTPHVWLSIGPPLYVAYRSILYHFRVIWRLLISWPWNLA